MKTKMLYAVLYHLVFTVLTLTVSVRLAHADETAPVGATQNLDEDWYWGFNLGGGGIRYKDASFQASMDAMKRDANVKHVSAYYDVYFLWPMASWKTALGVSFGGFADSYRNELSNSDFTFNTAIFGFSAHHYFTSNFGEGFFVRGDLGVANTRSTVKSLGITSTSATDRGPGVRLGIGYSIPLSSETRLPITLTFQHANTARRTGSNALLIGAGLLF